MRRSVANLANRARWRRDGRFARAYGEDFVRNYGRACITSRIKCSMEYIERCNGFEGFFTKSNVAELTEAAGADERYEHGHVFD